VQFEYEVEVAGRTRHVSVHRVEDVFLVSIDGREFRVDAARVPAQGGQRLSLKIGDRMFEASIAPDPASGQQLVRVGPGAVLVGLNGRRRKGRSDEDRQAAGGSGPQRIAAPMPGKIVRVLVAAGDTVAARQPVVVVEAMKMENELRAGREGKVAEVHAREGESVEAGALLVVIQ
jgi:biotin carboxyl carrier protein